MCMCTDVSTAARGESWLPGMHSLIWLVAQDNIMDGYQVIGEHSGWVGPHCAMTFTRLFKESSNIAIV